LFGCGGITTNIIEVNHAKGIPPTAPLLPQPPVLLQDLWQRLPDEARTKSLLTLSQIVARQLVPPPEQKEVENEDR
jgi:hypothetical protein